MKNEFSVKFPVEDFEVWVKEQGIEAGMVLDHQDLFVNDVSYDPKLGYVLVEGVLEVKLSS